MFDCDNLAGHSLRDKFWSMRVRGCGCIMWKIWDRKQANWSTCMCIKWLIWPISIRRYGQRTHPIRD